MALCVHFACLKYKKFSHDDLIHETKGYTLMDVPLLSQRKVSNVLFWICPLVGKGFVLLKTPKLYQDDLFDPWFSFKERTASNCVRGGPNDLFQESPTWATSPVAPLQVCMQQS